MTAPLPPGTALGILHPAARVEGLGKKHWHNVLFPSSEPATGRNLDMLEQWIVAMAEHLGIDVRTVPAPAFPQRPNDAISNIPLHAC